MQTLRYEQERVMMRRICKHHLRHLAKAVWVLLPKISTNRKLFQAKKGWLVIGSECIYRGSINFLFPILGFFFLLFLRWRNAVHWRWVGIVAVFSFSD